MTGYEKVYVFKENDCIQKTGERDTKMEKKTHRLGIFCNAAVNATRELCNN